MCDRLHVRETNALVEVNQQCLRHMRATEKQFCPAYPFKFHPASQINDRMRSTLYSWLNEVHLKYKLLAETLFITTNLVDRFAERAPITRAEY